MFRSKGNVVCCAVNFCCVVSAFAAWQEKVKGILLKVPPFWVYIVICEEENFSQRCPHSREAEIRVVEGAQKIKNLQLSSRKALRDQEYLPDQVQYPD